MHYTIFCRVHAHALHVRVAPPEFVSGVFRSRRDARHFAFTRSSVFLIDINLVWYNHTMFINKLSNELCFQQSIKCEMWSWWNKKKKTARHCWVDKSSSDAAAYQFEWAATCTCEELNSIMNWGLGWKIYIFNLQLLLRDCFSFFIANFSLFNCYRVRFLNNYFCKHIQFQWIV